MLHIRDARTPPIIGVRHRADSPIGYTCTVLISVPDRTPTTAFGGANRLDNIDTIEAARRPRG